MTKIERKRRHHAAWLAGERHASLGFLHDATKAAMVYGVGTQEYCAFIAGAENYRAYHRKGAKS